MLHSPAAQPMLQGHSERSFLRHRPFLHPNRSPQQHSMPRQLCPALSRFAAERASCAAENSDSHRSGWFPGTLIAGLAATAVAAAVVGPALANVTGGSMAASGRSSASSSNSSAVDGQVHITSGVNAVLYTQQPPPGAPTATPKQPSAPAKTAGGSKSASGQRSTSFSPSTAPDAAAATGAGSEALAPEPASVSRTSLAMPAYEVAEAATVDSPSAASNAVLALEATAAVAADGAGAPAQSPAAVGSRQVYFDVTVDGQSKGRITVALYDDVPVGSARFADLARGIQGVGFRRTKFDSVNQARQYHGARAEISLISCPKCNLHCTGPPVPIQARFTRIGHHQRSAWPFSLIHRGLNVVNRQYGCISQHDQAASSQVCSPVCCCASCK